MLYFGIIKKKKTMKNFKLLLLTFSIIGLTLTSCDPSVEAPGSEDSSVATFLPKITLEGGDVVLECDITSYSDPGAIAEAGGQEIELVTNVSATYFGGTSISGPDVYAVSYSAFNDDGIPATAFRYVTWPTCTGDLTTSIAGVYNCAMTRTPGYSTTEIGPIFISDTGDGVYAISDCIGGWYEHEYGYGSDYAAKGMTLTANDIASNDFTLNGSSTLPWGGDIVLTSFSVDSGAKTIEFTTEWTLGYVWEITLTQI